MHVASGPSSTDPAAVALLDACNAVSLHDLTGVAGRFEDSFACLDIDIPDTIMSRSCGTVRMNTFEPRVWGEADILRPRPQVEFLELFHHRWILGASDPPLLSSKEK